jgi:hypothetical protein
MWNVIEFSLSLSRGALKRKAQENKSSEILSILTQPLSMMMMMMVVASDRENYEIIKCPNE